MMDNGDATLLNASPQVRQKRVLPSRSRRGGPGVGNCDVDLMILNAQVSKSESEPLIPADTMFLLKTSDILEKVAAEFTSAGGSGLNLRARESYFDRPDVLKAYREQEVIETPEYEDVSNVPIAGSRLRQRTNVEETNLDSDAAYEKRHRKYEAFEKRQRLREKEKLKHEQYKLKERIEQLRGMDNSAFLAASASSFSPRPSGSEALDEDIALGAMGVLGGLNGNTNTPAYQEGERRRKEMLMNAQALEERYRVLLPPDRQRKPTGQSAVNVWNETESELSSQELARSQDIVGSDPEDYAPQANKKESQKIKIKVPPRPTNVTPTISTLKDPSASKKRRRSPPPPPPPSAHPPISRTAREIMPARVIVPAPAQVVSTSEPGPSSSISESQLISEPLLPNHYPTHIHFTAPYNPDSGQQRAGKRQRVSKRARTEERNERRAPTPSREHSDPLPDTFNLDDPPQRSFSPVQDPSHTYYSFPAPPQEDHRPSTHDSELSIEISSPPPSPPPVLPPQKPGSPVLSPSVSQIPEFYISRQSSSAPGDSSDPMAFANTSLPHVEPPAKEDEGSLHPPIEAYTSVSAPPAGPHRRGRSRGGARGGSVVTHAAATKPRKSGGRRVVEAMIMTTATRNQNKKVHRRRHDAWGCRLPEIILSNDPYAYELPPGINPHQPVVAHFEGDEDTDNEEGFEHEADERELEAAEEAEDDNDELESDGGT